MKQPRNSVILSKERYCLGWSFVSVLLKEAWRHAQFEINCLNMSQTSEKEPIFAFGLPVLVFRTASIVCSTRSKRSGVEYGVCSQLAPHSSRNFWAWEWPQTYTVVTGRSLLVRYECGATSKSWPCQLHIHGRLPTQRNDYAIHWSPKRRWEATWYCSEPIQHMVVFESSSPADRFIDFYLPLRWVSLQYWKHFHLSNSSE